jgi:hypothetical protein
MTTYALTFFGQNLSYGELALIAVCVLLFAGLIALAWCVRQLHHPQEMWREAKTMPQPTRAQLDEYFRD